MNASTDLRPNIRQALSIQIRLISLNATINQRPGIRDLRRRHARQAHRVNHKAWLIPIAQQSITGINSTPALANMLVRPWNSPATGISR
jgi:hypothetical protein